MEHVADRKFLLAVNAPSVSVVFAQAQHLFVVGVAVHSATRCGGAAACLERSRKPCPGVAVHALRRVGSPPACQFPRWRVGFQGQQWAVAMVPLVAYGRRVWRVGTVSRLADALSGATLVVGQSTRSVLA